MNVAFLLVGERRSLPQEDVIVVEKYQQSGQILRRSALVKPLSGGRSDARVVLTQCLDEIFPFAFSHGGKRTEQLVGSLPILSSVQVRAWWGSLGNSTGMQR